MRSKDTINAATASACAIGAATASGPLAARAVFQEARVGHYLGMADQTLADIAERETP